MSEIKELARKYEDYMIQIREDIHRHPEPSMQEFRTSKLVAAELEKLGIPYRMLEPSGVIAEIKGGKPGKTIGLRADMDALSVTEDSGVAFSSENEGFMHACGHDTHTAMLLGAAHVLMDIRDQLHGNVRLIFQPAEEIATGAKAVIAQDGLKGVDAMFGIHIAAMQPIGSVLMCAGPMGASCDQFKLRIHGKTTHGSAPEQGVDATVCAAAVIMNLQTIVSREVATTNPLVVTVGTVKSGARWNIVSGEAELEGTCRCFDVDLHHHIPEMMERIIKATCEAYRCTYEFQYDMLCEVEANDPGMEALAWKSAEKVVDDPASQVVEIKPSMGGEDFAEYTVLVPSTFADLGAGGTYPHHSEHFWVDESAFKTGAALYCQVAKDYLDQNA